MSSHPGAPVPEPPAELRRLRDMIDELDAQLVQVLARRFQVTDAVGRLKAAEQLPPLDANREAEQLARLHRLCGETGLDPSLMDELFTAITRLVKERHRRAASG